MSECCNHDCNQGRDCPRRKATQPAQEPVAWIRKNGFRFKGEIEPQDDSELPLYTTPQAPQPAMHQPVTDEENEAFSQNVSDFKGADPEATKYALEAFLRGRAAPKPDQEHVSALLARAAELHEKAQMPWPEAEKLALSESGVSEADIEELIHEHGSSFMLHVLSGFDDLKDYTRALLVHGPAYTTPQAPQPLTDAQIEEIVSDNSLDTIYAVIRAVEAAHGIKESK